MGNDYYGGSTMRTVEDDEVEVPDAIKEVVIEVGVSGARKERLTLFFKAQNDRVAIVHEKRNGGYTVITRKPDGFDEFGVPRWKIDRTSVAPIEFGNALATAFKATARAAGLKGGRQ